MVFIGLVCLDVPKTVRAQSIVVIIAIALSLTYIALTARNYRSVNRLLRDYYAALESIPTGQRVLFKTDRQLLYVGRITPFAYFRAYYYIERGGRIPPVQTEEVATQVGTLEFFFRPLLCRHSLVDRAHSLAKVGQLLAARGGEGVNLNGYAIALSAGRNEELTSLADKYGYKQVWTIGTIVVYRREFYPTEMAELSADAAYFICGFEQENDYVLLYQDESRIDQTIGENFDQTFAQGYAHVFKRRVICEQRNPETLGSNSLNVGAKNGPY